MFYKRSTHFTCILKKILFDRTISYLSVYIIKTKKMVKTITLSNEIIEINKNRIEIYNFNTYKIIKVLFSALTIPTDYVLYNLCWLFLKLFKIKNAKIIFSSSRK